MQNPVEWGVRDALKRILYFTSSLQSPLSRPWIIALLSSFFLPAKLSTPPNLQFSFRSLNFAVTELFHRFNPTFISLAREIRAARQAGARNRGSLGLSSGENSRVLGRSARFLPGVGFPGRAGTEQDARAQVPRPRWRGRASAKAAVAGRGGALNRSSGFRKSYF